MSALSEKSPEINPTEESFAPRLSAAAADKLWQSFKKDAAGLISCVVQEAGSKELLMLAYQDAEAFTATASSGLMHYHSRSRQCLWLKGESSGHYQRVQEVRCDCDLDALLYIVEQVGAACHTGAHSCFYRLLEDLDDVY